MVKKKNMVTIEEANREYKRKHPQGFFGKLVKSYREGATNRAQERAEMRALEQEAYRRAYRKARVRRAAREGSEAGAKRWYDNLQNFGTTRPSRVRVVSHRTKSKKKKKRYRIVDDPFDAFPKYDIMDNWGLMK